MKGTRKINPVNSKEGHLKLFYSNPTATVNFSRLIEVSKNRYKLLKDLEFLEESFKFSGESIDHKRITYSNKIKEYKLEITDQQTTQDDELSHFMLKLAFCNDLEDSRWWVNLETLLFKHRLKTSGLKNYKSLLPSEINEGILEKVKKTQIEVPFQEDLGNENEFYKVPLNLGMILTEIGYSPIDGYFYCGYKDLVYVFASLFREGLEHSVSKAKEAQITDQRIHELIQLIKNSEKDFTHEPEIQGVVNLENINQVAASHFPPCMKKLFDKLNERHHLKHLGRLQLGLFLKGTGLPFEEALKFWKTQFQPKVTSERFVKEYQYNIMHNYGKVGKMADYRPWSCSKIINLPNNSEEEFHGCPFKKGTKLDLAGVLRNYPISKEQREEILDKFPLDPQVSCLKLFRFSHPGVDHSLTEKVGRHPNAYVEASIKCRGTY